MRSVLVDVEVESGVVEARFLGALERGAHSTCFDGRSTAGNADAGNAWNERVPPVSIQHPGYGSPGPSYRMTANLSVVAPSGDVTRTQYTPAATRRPVSSHPFQTRSWMPGSMKPAVNPRT